MTDDAQFRRDLDHWLLRPDPREDPEYIRACEAAEAMEAYYTPRVITDFTNMRYKPGDTVKWTDPDGKHAQGVVIGATATDAHGWPEYVILHNKKVVTIDEMILAYGWTTDSDVNMEPYVPATSPPSDEIPF